MEERKNIHNIIKLDEVLTSPTEELRQLLNEIIAKNHLSADSTLALLARISAGYVNQMKRTVSKGMYDDELEESFLQYYNKFLVMFELNDVIEKTQKESREKIN